MGLSYFFCFADSEGGQGADDLGVLGVLGVLGCAGGFSVFRTPTLIIAQAILGVLGVLGALGCAESKLILNSQSSILNLEMYCYISKCRDGCLWEVASPRASVGKCVALQPRASIATRAIFRIKQITNLHSESHLLDTLCA